MSCVRSLTGRKPISRDEALSSQRVAYHLRAREWDAWITGYMEPVRPELIARVADGTFDGKVAGEYAAGTGYFTQYRYFWRGLAGTFGA